MGKKIKLEASDDPCMFQFFKQFVHQTEKNEFYCDGGYVRMDSPGVKVDFRSVDHTYEAHMWGRIMNIDIFTYKDENGKTLMYAVPSNLSPASEEFEDLVAKRVQMLRKANPDMEETAIPVELVTCSGSGLDQHISPATAKYQVTRIAKANNMSEEKVGAIIEKCTDSRFLGVFGEKTVNVLKVNLMLDGIL